MEDVTGPACPIYQLCTGHCDGWTHCKSYTLVKLYERHSQEKDRTTCLTFDSQEGCGMQCFSGRWWGEMRISPGTDNEHTGNNYAQNIDHWHSMKYGYGVPPQRLAFQESTGKCDSLKGFVCIVVGHGCTVIKKNKRRLSVSFEAINKTSALHNMYNQWKTVSQ